MDGTAGIAPFLLRMSEGVCTSKVGGVPAADDGWP